MNKFKYEVGDKFITKYTNFFIKSPVLVVIKTYTDWGGNARYYLLNGDSVDISMSEQDLDFNYIPYVPHFNKIWTELNG